MKFKAQMLTIMMMTSISIFAFAQDENREARQAAKTACFTETGVTKPTDGSRLSEEDRQKIKTCMESKGFTRSERGHGRGKDPAVKAAFEACAAENNLTKPEPGVRPSDEDRAKMEACLSAKGITLPAHKGRGNRGQGFGSTAQ